MSTEHLTTVTVETPEQVRDFLLEADVLGPSLHPRTLANGGVPGSWGDDGVWNGWNFATTCGRDANGVHVMLRSVHYASGQIDFNGSPVGETPCAGDLEFAFAQIAFPVEVLPVSRHILHPEHTPEFVVCPECDQGKCGNCTVDILTDDEEWVECLCRHLGAPAEPLFVDDERGSPMSTEPHRVTRLVLHADDIEPPVLGTLRCNLCGFEEAADQDGIDALLQHMKDHHPRWRLRR